MKLLKTTFILILILSLSLSAYSKYVKDLKELFLFERKLDLFSISSTLLTDSEIRYSIIVDKNYNIIKKEPVIVYRYYPGTKTYRKLNWAERNQAYGIKKQLKNSKDSCVLYLDQYPNMKISIFIKDKKAYPLAKLDNKIAVLSNIKAKANKGLLGIPEVEYVDVTGYDYKSKKIITKRIKHNN